MSLADPTILTFNSIPFSLYNISRGNLTGAYRATDGLTLFDVSHVQKRTREEARVKHDVHLEVRKPKEETPTDYHSMHMRFILDRPESLSASLGWTETEIAQLITGFNSWVSVAGNITKLISLQS